MAFRQVSDERDPQRITWNLQADAQMRELLDVPAALAPLRRVLPQLFEKMRQTGWTRRLVTEVNGGKYYTVALDGSQYFSSTKIACEQGRAVEEEIRLRAVGDRA